MAPIPNTTSQNLVQAKASSVAASGNVSLTFASNVTAGDLLIAAVAYTASPVGSPVISDTFTDNWVEVGVVSSILNGTMVNLMLFWTVAQSSGSCTVTANMSDVSGPTGVWLVIGEFNGANSLALISGSTLGYGVNPPFVSEQAPSSNVIQAINPPLTTPQGSLMIVVATTGNGSATWSVDVQNNWYSIAAQGGGIVLAYSTNMYSAAPFCDQQPPRPILDETGDSSSQWVILTAPFTTTVLPPMFQELANTDVPQPFPQYPTYPYTNTTQ